jgi:hypothetical protein
LMTLLLMNKMFLKLSPIKICWWVFSSKFFVNLHCLVIGKVRSMLKLDFPKMLAHVKQCCQYSVNIWLSSRLFNMCLVRLERMGSLLDDHELDMQCSYLRLWPWFQIMKQSWKKINLWLWAKFNFVSIFKHKCLEFIKIVKIACVQVLGFVENEFYFSMVAHSWK